MLILKTVSLGLLLCFLGTIGYLYWLVGPFEQGKATGLTLLRAMTIQQPIYWLGVAAMFAVSFAFFRFTR
jgi:hypothetical protein